VMKSSQQQKFFRPGREARVEEFLS
jgi:hypothetical protein